MSDVIISSQPPPIDLNVVSADPLCAVCGRETPDGRVPISALDQDMQVMIAANAAVDAQIADVCTRCLELFERAKEQIASDAAVFEQGGHVLSTPLRLDADDRFTGRGVTIAFLDSGFYRHVDLTTPKNRILAYYSIAAADGDKTTLDKPDVASWHGMMTSVVAAGNGSPQTGFIAESRPRQM